MKEAARQPPLSKLCPLLTCWRLAFAHAGTADHLILRRVVAVNTFDPGADALELIPQGNEDRITPVTQIGQLGI